MRIGRVQYLTDNYAWVIHSGDGEDCAIVDPGEGEPVIDYLRREGLTPRWILATHHHADHTGGIQALLDAYGDISVLCSQTDKSRVPSATAGVDDEEKVAVAGAEAVALLVPGHTRGSVAWWFPGEAAIFTGDTLFGGGCGRLFEGSPEEMHASLSRLRALPEETAVYCGHEYTEKNLLFARSVVPDDGAVLERLEETTRKRHDGRPTIPSSIGIEKRTNPFLRAGEELLMHAAGKSDPVSAFAELRRRRDAF